MTQQEFTLRTGVEISRSEFDATHTVYMFSELDKDEFCEMWCKMNATRVKRAKVERMEQYREAAYKDTLHKWFNKWRGTQKLHDNYNTPMAHIKISTYEVRAMSYAGIMLDGTLSDVCYKVGLYLGIYKDIEI